MVKNNNYPKHVAIVMDGNGRWAKARHMPRLFGHKKGVESVRAVVRGCIELGIPNLTLFAFSSENWKRPADEVGGLMSLFMTALDRESAQLKKNGIRLKLIGDLSGFSLELQSKVRQVEEMTAEGKQLNLIVAANYGGRWDITEASRQMLRAIEEGSLAADDIDERTLGSFMATNEIVDPDLYIRTGGVQRISNFLLWQLAYSELYFTDKLWPDFNQDELRKAVEEYTQRERRFGMTSEQIKEYGNA